MIERTTDMKKEQLEEVQIILHFLLANKGFGINNIIRFHFYIVGNKSKNMEICNKLS